MLKKGFLFLFLLSLHCTENRQPLRVYFNVMVANIMRGAEADRGLDRLACYFNTADIVLLQEVDNGTSRSGKVNQPRVLSEKSALKYNAFGKTFDFQGGEYGLALLSRYPISNIHIHRISDESKKECILVQAVISFFSQRVNVFVTHLPSDQHGDLSPFRQQAIAFIMDKISHVQGPVLLGGDFNAEKEKPEILQITAYPASLQDSWNAAPLERDHCGRRIDYLFFRGPYTLRQYEAPCWPLNDIYLPKYERPDCPLRGVGLSDHPFLFGRFEITGTV